MKAQTQRPDQWIVVDDGREALTPTAAMQYVRREPRSDDPKHTLAINLKVVLPLVKGDKILIFEDDEYYAPSYIAEMSRRLDSHEVVGICRSKYYHLPTGSWQQIGNTGHASLAQTAFRKSFLPVFEQCVRNGMETNWIDQQIWATISKMGDKANSELFVDEAEPLYVGIKGLSGRPGIGLGHKLQMYHDKDSPDRDVLKRWIPCDYRTYLDVIAGMT
jgi:hypothetical protein